LVFGSGFIEGEMRKQVKKKLLSGSKRATPRSGEFWPARSHYSLDCFATKVRNNSPPSLFLFFAKRERLRLNLYILFIINNIKLIIFQFLSPKYGT